MATSVTLGPALWQDGPTYNGEIARQMGVAANWFCGGTVDALAVRGGVISNSTGSLQVLPVSGMNIKVASGFAIVPSSSSNINAGYQIGTMASVGLTVATADATNPRVDLVVIGVNDTGDSTGAGFIEIVTGTPAASPVAPSLPANSLSLGTIKVAANSTSVASTNITDTRVYTSAAGGVIPWPTLTGIPAGHPGLIAFDTANSRFFHNDANGADQLAVLPWKPVYMTVNSPLSLSVGDGTPGSSTQIGTALTVTTDGHTDIKVTVHQPGIYSTNASVGGYNQYNFSVYIDGNQLCGYHMSCDNSQVISTGGQSAIQGGGTVVYSTSSASGDTPSAGSHTITWKATVGRYNSTGSPTGNGSSAFVWASTAENAYMRVEPVAL